MTRRMKSQLIVASVRLLAWRNGLESFLSYIGVLWGLSVLAFPHTWGATYSTNVAGWQVAPPRLAWVLLLTGLLGALSLVMHWRYLRMQSSVVAFIAWGLMAVWSYQALPAPLINDVAIYSAFAVAELAIYVRILAGLDPVGEVKSGALIGLDRRRGDSCTRSDTHAGDH